MTSSKRWRVELVGGPFCGKWVLQDDPLPDDRTIYVTTGLLAVALDNPLMANVGPCEYFLETDEADAEQRASFVRQILSVS